MEYAQTSIFIVNRYMRAYTLFLLLFVAACGNNKQPKLSGKWLNAANLPSDVYEINPDKDTILYTRKGAILNITKGSIYSKSGGNVRLEVKEAYNTTDMILAGLVTTADGTTLSSGGMIYINTTSPSIIAKPIGVAIPTDKKVKGMEVYKGIEKDGTIDWVEPTPLPVKTMDYEKGKNIFRTNCESCHNVYKDATGPQLAYITQRRDWEWFKAFVRNSSKLIADGDKYANCVYYKWNKIAMTAFPTLTEADFVALANYLETYNEQYPPEMVPDAKKCFDECTAYFTRIEELNSKRQELVYDNGRLVKTYKGEGVIEDFVTPVDGDSTKRVTIAYARSEYYQIEVNAFGWYNIDIPAQILPGFEKCNITVAITGEYTNNIELYIIVPEYKIFNPGGRINGEKNTFGFFSDNGELPMVIGKKAYILAVGEENKQLVYAMLPFTTAKELQLSIQLKATTKEAMNEAIATVGINDIDIKANDTKNAKDIRQIDAELEELKKHIPAGCYECCGINIEDTATIQPAGTVYGTKR
ncbi:hypothetical protein CAP35_12320 [Chitinophagaceae bacterium IBVUCB1]|nr:hypothetical protein CAP35_12320 [Chitinophagaceae bacterium IBVUCB1]